MSSEKMKQYWDVKIIDDNPVFPFLVIDNWYTPNEEKAVWKELDFFSVTPKENTERAETSIVAKHADGTPKSKAFRYYIETFYNKRELSPIINCMYKQRTPEFHNIVGKILPYSRMFIGSNRDSSLISYYEEKDHYESHHDAFQWTCLIWMVREPRLFDGGNFKIDESDTEVRLKNNRMVMFPCCYSHSVSPVKFHTQPKEIGYGRYTITHFYYSIPTGDIN